MLVVNLCVYDIKGYCILDVQVFILDLQCCGQFGIIVIEICLLVGSQVIEFVVNQVERYGL